MAESFRKEGFTTLTVDNTHYPENNINTEHAFIDVLTLTKQRIIDNFGEPTVMWFGTPCKGFSVASIGKNWFVTSEGYEPKTETAKEGIIMAKKCLEIINWFPKAIWVIENPRGMLRTMPFMHNDKRRTITFCQYGDNRMKPTDLWTNADFWITKPHCKNGDPCHVSAPRGAKTGTQGLKGAYERAVYPKAFCDDFAQQTKRFNKNG